MSVERTDVLVIGTGFGGAISAYNLAAGGAKVVMLERGPELGAADFTQSLEIGGYTRPDHPARVAALSVAMGRDLGMARP